MVRAVRGLGVFWGLRDDRRRWNTGGKGDGTRRCGAHTVRSSSGPVPRRCCRGLPAGPGRGGTALWRPLCPVTVAWPYFSFRMLFTDPFILTFSLASYYNYSLKKLLFSGKRMF